MPGFHKMMHVAAIAPFPNFLAKVIDMGYLYTIDSDGNTPLTYALEHNNSECISIILNRFDKGIFLATCKDIDLLLQSKHPGMHYLFKHCCFNYTYLNATPPRGYLHCDQYLVTSNSLVLKQSDLER